MRSKVEVAALCVGNALGTCVGFVVPLWIAAFIREDFLSSAQVGWLASAQLFVLAGAGIATALRGGAFNLRRIGVLLAAVGAMGMLLAAVHVRTSVVTGLLLFAAASGVLHALMIRAGALRANAPRVLALMTASAMGLGSLTTYLSRHAMQRIGSSGLFLMLAGLSILAALFMRFAFPNRHFDIEVTEPKPQDQPRATLPVAPFFACLAGALVNMAGMMVGAYTLVIAPGLGFSAAAATTALAISEPFALLGPLASHRLGERWGALPPILVGLAVLAVNPFLLVNAPNVQTYTLSMIVSGVTFAFYIPYAIAFVGRLEPTGRLVGALPGLITIGASIGPALGGTVIHRYSFQTLAPAAAALYGLAVMLFVVAGRLIPKESAI